METYTSKGEHMTKDEALKLALYAIEDKDYHGAHYLIVQALAQPEQKPVAWEQFHEYLVERNFCPRCGKRLASGFVEISIHTCTPPRDIK